MCWIRAEILQCPTSGRADSLGVQVCPAPRSSRYATDPGRNATSRCRSGRLWRSWWLALLQGSVLRCEDRVQRPASSKPYPDLRSCSRWAARRALDRLWILWAAPAVAFTWMLTVPILIPVVTEYPLPLSGMGESLGGGLAPRGSDDCAPINVELTLALKRIATVSTGRSSESGSVKEIDLT
jgi:hypothetical protein